MSYSLSVEAAEQLESVFVYGVLEFGELQAAKYQQSFHSTFEALAAMPYMARVSERHRSKERRFLHGSHVIYFTVHETEIVIREVVHGAVVKDPWGDAKSH